MQTLKKRVQKIRSLNSLCYLDMLKRGVGVERREKGRQETVKLSVLASWGCCKKSQLTPMEMYSLSCAGQKPQVSITGLKSRCQQGYIPSGGSKNPSLVSFSLWLLLAFIGLWVYHPNLKTNIFKYLFALSSQHLLLCVLVSNLPLPLLEGCLGLYFKPHVDHPE